MPDTIMKQQGVSPEEDEKRSISDATITAECVKQKQCGNLPLGARFVKNQTARQMLLFLGLQLALFLNALDSTIISTSLPRIGSDFNEMPLVAWVSSGYLLTFDSFQPLFSKFSDIFGRKWILIFGVSIFLLASVICGTSQTIIVLIIGRVIQGIGAAASFSMVFVITSDIVPANKRGSYQGILSAVYAMSSILGPLIGGSLTDYVSWRWNFYINIPIGAFALFTIILFLDIPTPEGSLTDKLRRVDYLGTFNVLAFSTLFLLAMNFGGRTFPWRSAAVIVPLVLSAVMVALLIIVETKFAKEPLMPPHLFKRRSVVAILACNWFFGISFLSVLYFLPMYLQVIRGDTATKSGIRMIPFQLVATIFAAVAGFFTSKTGIYRALVIVGTAFLTIAIGLISVLDSNSPFSEMYGFSVLGGIGIGLVFSATVTGIQLAAEPQDIAVATGLGNFSRILGGALGVSISAAVLNSNLSRELPGKMPDVYVQLVIKSPESLRDQLPSKFFDTVIRIYMDSIRLIWYVMIPMSGVSFFSALFVKHRSFSEYEQNSTANNDDRDPKEQVYVSVHRATDNTTPTVSQPQTSIIEVQSG